MIAPFRALAFLSLALVVAGAQPPPRPDAVHVYKRVGADSLVIHLFTPKHGGRSRPAAVLFHGGGFVWGGPEITDGSALHYASMGIVGFSVEYRLVDRKTITPIEQYEDAVDAMKWVRAHAADFGVDRKRVFAHGVSAGGWLATMVAGSTDNAVRPNALVLWSPGVGEGDPYFNGLFGGRANGMDWSPLRRIQEPMPPMIIISGINDSVTFDIDSRRYCAHATSTAAACEMHSYPNLGHLLTTKLDARSQAQGKFDFDGPATADAEARVRAFLHSLGYVAK